MAKADLTPIKEWLDNKERNYATGLALLVKFNRNRAMQTMLARKENMPKLEYELNKILTINGSNPGAVVNLKDPDKNPIVKTNPDNEPIDVSRWQVERKRNLVKPENLPETLKACYMDATMKYKKIRSLHEKLKLLKDGTDEERKPVALEIRELDKAIRDNWDKIDAWDGKPIENKPEKPKKELPTVKQVNAARTYISRNKSALNNASKKANILPKIQERVNTLQNAFVELEETTVKELKAHGVTF